MFRRLKNLWHLSEIDLKHEPLQITEEGNEKDGFKWTGFIKSTNNKQATVIELDTPDFFKE